MPCSEPVVARRIGRKSDRPFKPYLSPSALSPSFEVARANCSAVFALLGDVTQFLEHLPNRCLRKRYIGARIPRQRVAQQ